MTIDKISFGKVTAITGPSKKIKYANAALEIEGGYMIKDVTGYYKNVVPYGALAKAAQNGEIAQIVVTGSDITKIVNKEPGWDNLDNILSHMSGRIDLNKTGILKFLKQIRSFKQD